MTHTVIVGVGSNIQPAANIKKAAVLLKRSHSIIKRSKFVRTKPIGFTEQADFLNGAFLLKTELSLIKFRKELKSIEAALGRRPQKNKFGPRTIDLDIVVWDKRIVDADLYKRIFLKNAVLSLLPDLNLKQK